MSHLSLSLLGGFEARLDGESLTTFGADKARALLAGFFVRDSLGFEEWRLARQEVLHRQALEVLTKLTAYHEGRGEYDRVQDYARRLINLEPWNDQSHLQLMHACRYAGQTPAALEQYETYRQVLADELGLEPSAAATALYEAIKTGDNGLSTATISGPDRSPRPTLHSPGERRQVTVLTCGRAVVRIPHDPEELYDHMASCRQQCEAIVSQFGGYRLRRLGDKCVILFGYPQALEDTPRRAVDASLAMTNSLLGNADVSVGIHTGVIVKSKQRGSLAEDPDICSDAPNFARPVGGPPAMNGPLRMPAACWRCTRRLRAIMHERHTCRSSKMCRRIGWWLSVGSGSTASIEETPAGFRYRVVQQQNILLAIDPASVNLRISNARCDIL